MNSDKGGVFCIQTPETLFSSIKLLQYLNVNEKYTLEKNNRISVTLEGILQNENYRKAIVKAFEHSGPNLLTIECMNKGYNPESAKELFDALSGITKKNPNKKIIFITQEDPSNVLATHFANIQYDNDPIPFNGFQPSKASEDKNPWEKKLISLQGGVEKISLKELIQPKELVQPLDLSSIDLNTLADLVRGKEVTIGSQPLGTSDLEGAYAELFEKVNKEALETNLSNSPPEVIYVISGIPIQGKEEEVKNSLMNNLGHEQDNDNLKGKINILTPPYFLPSTDTGKNIQLVDNAFQEVHFKDLCNKHVGQKIHWIRWHDGNAPKFELQKIYNPGFYIDRGFNKEVVFKSNKIGEILTGGKIGTFVFSGDIFGDDEKHNYKQLSTLLETKDPSSEDGFKTLTDNSDTLFVIKDQGAAREKFDKLDGTVHWLEVKGDDNKQIIWRNSKGCVKPDLDNVNYVSMDTLRKCVDTDGPKNDLCKENDLLKAIEDKQAVIIADDPGMGKSTSLIKLCQQLYKQKPGTVESPESPWIINVSLKNCLQEVRSIKKPDEDINMADLVGFLSKVGKNLDGKFAKELLQLALDPTSTEKFPKPLLVTFDGFDEVLDQEVRGKILELLKALKDKTRAKFWVTTRLQHKESLENALSTFAVTFKPLDVDAQKIFIEKFFQDRLSLLLPKDKFKEIFRDGYDLHHDKRISNYTEAFIKKMESLFQGNVSSFIGTPLQLALLLESKGSIEAFKKWAEEDNANAVPDFAYLGNNILEVYENFIQGKYETYFKKVGVKQGEVQQATKDFCNRLHRNLAGALVSSSGSDKKVRRHEAMALSVGLIKSEDNKLSFIHPTFGEYFASRTYMDWIEKEPVFPNTNKHKHLLEKILIHKDYRVIRSFLNARLKNKALPEETLKQYGKVVSGLWEQRSDGTGKKTILHAAVEEDNLEIITFLQKILKEEPSTAKKFLLAKDSDKNTAWFLAAQRNIKALEQFWQWAQEICAGKDLLLATDRDGNTLWHLAAQRGDIEAIRKLWGWIKDSCRTPDTRGAIDSGRDLLLAKNSDGNTIWHLAIIRGKTEVVTTLRGYAKKAQFTDTDYKNWLLAKNSDGNTALHLATRRGNSDVFESLLTWAQNYKVVEDLLKATDSHGITVLDLLQGVDESKSIIKKIITELKAKKQENPTEPMSKLLTQVMSSFLSKREGTATTSALIPNTDQMGNVLFQCGITSVRD